MIKAKIGDLYIIGLSEINIQRLKQNQPIFFDLAEIGLTGQMAIIAGKTEEDLTNTILDLKRNA